MQFIIENQMMVIVALGAFGAIFTLGILIAILRAIFRKQAQAESYNDSRVEETSSSAPNNKSYTITAIIKIALMMAIAAGGVIYWQHKIQKYKGPITPQEQEMLLTAKDLNAYGFKNVKPKGNFEKNIGANGLPSLYYTQGEAWKSGYLECRINRLANLKGVSSSYSRPGVHAGTADELITLGDDHKCWQVKNNNTVGVRCYVRVDLTQLIFEIHGVYFSEKGGLDELLNPKMKLLSEY